MNFKEKQTYEIGRPEDEIFLRTIIEPDIELIRIWRNRNRDSFLYDAVISPEEQLNWLNRYQADPTDYMFILYYKGKPVGTAALYHLDNNSKSAEYGRLIVGEARGHGLGKIITSTICNFGMNEMGLIKIYMDVFPDNMVSRHVCEACGFRVVGQDIKNNRQVLKMQLDKK